ncbi:sigma-54-dependent transcriptional regulator [Rosettibacter firmus]|uniref:sigma-54-dependent transcriptional regulator n=1 Tax=Rosettibacter firmus TaxID=3111522 RepID=UPI00336BE92A
MNKGRILVIDDEPNILKMIELSLSSAGYIPEVYLNAEDGINRAKEVFFDLSFVDLKMQPINGIQVLEALKKISPDTTIVLMTAYGSIETAVEAIKKGAYDYITKPFTHKEFLHIVDRVFEHHKMSRKIEGFKSYLEEDYESNEIITNTESVKETLKIAQEVADSDIPILIEGESGTGKEILAKYIHSKSSRRSNPFVAVNCSAIPENLFESEMFGHVKGAFTNALKDRIGRIEFADTGTLFFDEVGDIPKLMQVKLLRFLQSMEYERVGESITRKADVRIISATNKKVDEELKSGNLREDFYYRIAGVKLYLPPLRERKGDIPLLLNYFLKKYSKSKEYKINNELIDYLVEYDWPGNIREFETLVKRLIVFAKDNVLRIEYLPVEILNFIPQKQKKEILTIEELEKQHIKDVLKIASSMKEAAQILGISETTLWRKKKLYNL